MSYSIYLGIETFFLFLCLAFAQNLCKTPENQLGFCVNYRLCPNLINMMLHGESNTTIQRYIRQALCGTSGSDILVCCATSFSPLTIGNPIGTFGSIGTTQSSLSTSTILFTFAPVTNPPLFFNPTLTSIPIIPSSTSQSIVHSTPIQLYRLPTQERNECGVSNATHSRVVGGTAASRSAWPWIAALGYQLSGETSPRFLCAANLITARHLLTAGHCIKVNLTLVRLGTHNLEDPNDGSIDVPIESKMLHEQYDEKRILNDIGIIRLARDVQFSERIRPICLPAGEQVTKDYTNFQPFVAGWGETDVKRPSVNELQEVQVQIMSTQQCEQNYKLYFPNQVFDDRVLCAGWNGGGRDSCQGDSGGPLMLPVQSSTGQNKIFILLGLVSYGYDCGKAGFHGVYTRVPAFLPWIESHLNN